jgi:glycosyltransferase involved in cell wall biosynthesis
MAASDTAMADWQVPSSDVREFGPRARQYCIAIFVINEGEKIRAQLTRMQPLTALADVVIADGGSTDGSLAADFLAERGVRTLLVKTGAGKLGAQMRMAFAYALRAGYEGVITIDGNNKDDPSAIPAFIAALDDGADHVQGSRFIPGGVAIRTPLSRLLGIRFLHAPLIALASGFRYTDTTNGFRAYSRRFLLDPRVAPFRDVFSRYELHYYLAIRAARLGFDVRELPVTRAYPAHGPTPTKISPIRGNLLVLRTLFAACLHRFDPPEHSPRR